MSDEDAKSDPDQRIVDGDDDTTPGTDEFGLAEDVVDASDNDPETASDDSSVADHGADSSLADGADADAPLSSLASSVEQRRSDNRDRPDDELFSEESVPEIDAEVVWERLDEDEPPELPEDGQHDVQVIEKRSYCEQCPFFSTPPEVSCAHDGTEILELVDMDHFRVVDCPKVREDERLERL